jgi:hypothetical protein
MASVDLWVIEHGIGRFGSWSQVAQQFVILPEQGVDHPNQLAGYPPKRFSSTHIGLRPFVVAAHPGNQALVELGPLTVAMPE